MNTDSYRGEGRVTRGADGKGHRMRDASLREAGMWFSGEGENALAHELRTAGLHVTQQVAIPVYYDGMVVGDYVADMIVEGVLILELKACTGFDKIHFAQCINYLKATGKEVCLLFNFGKPRLEFKRIIATDTPN